MTENIKAVPKEEVAVVEKKYLKRIKTQQRMR